MHTFQKPLLDWLCYHTPSFDADFVEKEEECVCVCVGGGGGGVAVPVASVFNLKCSPAVISRKILLPYPTSI